MDNDICLKFAEWLATTNYYRSYNGNWYDWNEKNRPYTTQQLFTIYLMIINSPITNTNDRL